MKIKFQTIHVLKSMIRYVVVMKKHMETRVWQKMRVLLHGLVVLAPKPLFIKN